MRVGSRGYHDPRGSRPRSQIRTNEPRNLSESHNRSERISLWLTSWGTFISAIAAAAGLLIGGIAAYATLQTARDTRAAIERDLDQERAEQASQVTFWEEESAEATDPGEQRDVKLHVINRSLDPVPRWSLTYWGRKYGSDGDTEVRMAFVALPPCTELIVNSSSTFAELNWNMPEKEGSLATFQSFAFTDTGGNSWMRDSEGTLTPIPSFGTRSFYNLNKTLKDSRSTMRPAKECGNGS